MKSKKVVVIYLFVIISSLLILVALYHGNSIAYPGGSVAISFYLDASRFTLSPGVMLCIKWTTMGLEPAQLNILPTCTLELGYNRSVGV